MFSTRVQAHLGPLLYDKIVIKTKRRAWNTIEPGRASMFHERFEKKIFFGGGVLNEPRLFWADGDSAHESIALCGKKSTLSAAACTPPLSLQPPPPTNQSFQHLVETSL